MIFPRFCSLRFDFFLSLSNRRISTSTTIRRIFWSEGVGGVDFMCHLVAAKYSLNSCKFSILVLKYPPPFFANVQSYKYIDFRIVLLDGEKFPFTTKFFIRKVFVVSLRIFVFMIIQPIPSGRFREVEPPFSRLFEPNSFFKPKFS